MTVRRLVALCLVLCVVSYTVTGCASGSGGSSSPSDGLTSIEAAELAWKTGGKVFDQAVLWRMIPSSDEKATTTQLATDWQESDRSAGWFVWLADRGSGDWFMVGIEGTKVTSKDIGTREFSATPMGADWPSERPAVAMKDAAKAAAGQGADLSALTWTEFACDYAASDARDTPVWMFAFAETLTSGDGLNYRILVNGITGKVLLALNDRDERMALPIDREALQKPHSDSHEKDLRQFFGFISTKQPEWAVRQLASSASPNEATAQMWLANFQSLSALTVVSVEQVSLDQWRAEHEFYKVKLDVKTSEPQEKYGWDNGLNFRWVELIPEGGGSWKVASLAPSP
jgi:hypothetical protein